jgi:hypothetical protein
MAGFRKASQPPPQPFVDALDRRNLECYSKDQLIIMLQVLYLTAKRLRRELDALQGIVR